ncbi:MAG TPA: hypothetical protein VG387_17285 [Rhizomicrobium sp.]|jgi:hypothetical protein|nr:hypothetical protein [Rhizomicrobium sp.]
MRLIILSAAFTLAATTAALAVGAGWNGPGWYIVMNTPMKQNALYRGAYPDKDACMAAKPDDRGALQYDCVKFNNEPLDN